MRALAGARADCSSASTCPRVAVLETAYDDAQGVTAQFNLNVLAHLNRLIGSDFEANDWQHRASFNAQESRIEMHLEARAPWLCAGPAESDLCRRRASIRKTATNTRWIVL